MKLIQSMVLGTIAALPFAVAAQAADLPSRKAAPVAYVKICDVYGRGFYYIPGTNTCLKVGGRVRFELAYRPASNVWVHGRGGGSFTLGKTSDTVGWRARAYMAMDARTQTAWGTVQTVFLIAVRSRSGLFGGSGNGPQGAITGSPQVYRAYIRFAGFTVGRAAGNFYFMPSRMYEPQYYASSATGELQIAYTAVFGNGFSATIALEDRNDFGYEQRANRVTLVGTPAAAVFPNRAPVIIGKICVDQGWGSAQIMAAWVPNSMVTTMAGTTYSVRKPGWAVGAGLTIKLPMLAKGDAIHFMAAYANGALDFTHSRYPNGTTSHGRLMGGMRVQYSNVTLYSPNGMTALGASPTSWSIAMIFTHYWTPTLRSNFAASYLVVKADSVSRTLDWYNNGGLRGTRAYAMGANLIWSPTRQFDIGLEIGYRKVTNQLTGIGPVWGSAAAPNTIGVKKDPSMVFGRLRVERRF